MTYGITLAARLGRWLAGCKAPVLVCCVLGMASVALAAEPAVKSFDIPAGSAERTLREFSAQSGIQALFPTETVKGVSTVAVKGEMTAKQALDQMLAGTPLVGVQDADTGSLSIVREDSAEKAAKNVSGAIVQDSGRPARKGKTELDANGEPVVKLDTFEVFGQKTLNMDIQRTRDDAQPYVVFDQRAISQSGAENLHEFLRSRLTMNATYFSTDQQSSTAWQPTSVINLRGLGSNQTLILVDGHRIAGANAFGGGTTQPDINGIPLAAIERIEILPTTASGIYGGSATGGVVNVVLRRNYSGTELKFSYANTFDTDAAERRVDFTTGLNLLGGKTNILIAGSHSDQNQLLIQDRDLYARGVSYLLAHSPATFYSATIPPLGATTNYRSLTGTPLTFSAAYGGSSLGAAFGTVPTGYGGLATGNVAPLMAGAGTYNFGLAADAQNDGGRQALLSASTRDTIGVTVRQELSHVLETFADFSLARTKSVFPTNPVSSYFILSPGPASPFTTPVIATVPVLGTDRAVRALTESSKWVVGLIAKLPHEWKSELDYTWSRNSYDSFLPNAALLSGASAAVSSGAIDVFRDYNGVGAPFAGFVAEPNHNGPAVTYLSDVNLRLGGRFPWTFFGITPELSVALEHRDESAADYLQDSVSGTSHSYALSYGRSQVADSAVFETKVPFVTPEKQIPGVRHLELQLAGRTETYNSEGTNTVNFVGGGTIPPRQSKTNRISSTNPTMALVYSPVSDLMVRASYGTGFLPPNIGQIYSTDYSIAAGLFTSRLGIRDSQRGNETIGAVINRTGGNSDLRPEKSRSWSAGVVYTPKVLTGLRASIDWTRIEKRDNIGNLGFSSQADFDLIATYFPERLVRGPVPPGDPYSVGPITIIDTSLVNFARTTVEAIDLSLDYSFPTTSWGTFELNGAATRSIHFETQATPVAPIVEIAGSISGFGSAIRWKGNSSLSWRKNQWEAAWTVRYFDSYFLVPSHAINARQASATIPSQIYHDVFVGYHFKTGEGWKRWLANTELQLAVNNVLNREPPVFALLAPGYYDSMGDPRLSNYRLSLRKSF